MSLIELIAGVEAHETVLTAVNTDPEAVTALEEHFRDRHVSVTAGDLDGDPRSFVVLSRDGEFVTAVSVDEILRTSESTDPGFETESYRPILDHLDETMFTSYSIGQMVAASREIEDRAFRIGSGQLHSGFQTLSVLASEIPTYNRIASRAGLDIHAYAAPKGDVPEHGDFTIHIERDGEIRNTWFVVYDGAGIDENKCALLAEERGDREFYGFWSYDPGTVDYIISHLTTKYGLIETDGGTESDKHGAFDRTTEAST
ncbi:DICT sensory domain-containing protein [Halalkalirubrum salinum]|uniref:DICT sensory domain-containing protein n=1 Tax=Halalkalirubrum salinum TaxID=2563889 RepID=UPI0010FB8F89|nr:DICT sensory domain-containing protein [Halalkalirubrum salinum]